MNYSINDAARELGHTRRWISILKARIKNGEELVNPPGPKPVCECGACKVCRGRIARRKSDAKRRVRNSREIISDEELERRINAYWERVKD